MASGWTRVRPKEGRIESLYTAPPEDSVVVCLDEKDAERGAQEKPTTGGAARPRRAGATGGRLRAARPGYVLGALRPATGGEALTYCYGGRTIANWVDFLGHVTGHATGCPPRPGQSTQS